MSQENFMKNDTQRGRSDAQRGRSDAQRGRNDGSRNARPGLRDQSYNGPRQNMYQFSQPPSLFGMDPFQIPPHLGPNRGRPHSGHSCQIPQGPNLGPQYGMHPQQPHNQGPYQSVPSFTEPPRGSYQFPGRSYVSRDGMSILPHNYQFDSVIKGIIDNNAMPPSSKEQPVIIVNVHGSGSVFGKNEGYSGQSVSEQRGEMPGRGMGQHNADRRGGRPWRGRGHGPNQGGRGGMYSRQEMGEKNERENEGSFGGLKKRSTSEVSLCSTGTAREWDDIQDDSSVECSTEHRQGYRGHRGGGRSHRPRGGRWNRGSNRGQKQNLPGRGSKNNGPQIILGTDGNVISSPDHLEKECESEEVVVEHSDSEDSESVSGDDNECTDLVRTLKKHKHMFARNDPKRFSKGKLGRHVSGKLSKFAKTSAAARAQKKSGIVPVIETEVQKPSSKPVTSPSREEGPDVGDLLASLQNLSKAEITKECTDSALLYGRQERQEKTSNDDNRPSNIPETQADSEVPEASGKVCEEDGKVQEVFNYLLQHFNGRAEFSKLKKIKNYFPDEAHAVSWFKKHGDKFLVFEDKQEVKFISVVCRFVRLCNRYNNNDCRREDCSYLHICMHFITGGCSFQNCLSHNFFDKRNNNRSRELGFGGYNNKQVAKIVRCSIPEVCMDYQNRTCMYENACPQIHLCRKKYCNRKCGLTHDIKGSPHNMWVLNSFRLCHLKDDVLNNMLLHRKFNYKQIQLKQQKEVHESKTSLESEHDQDRKADDVKPKKRVRKSSHLSHSEESSHVEQSETSPDQDSQQDKDRKEDDAKSKRRASKSSHLSHSEESTHSEQRPLITEISSSIIQINESLDHAEVPRGPVPKPRLKHKPDLVIDTGRKEDKSSDLERSSSGLVAFKFESDEEVEVVEDENKVKDDDAVKDDDEAEMVLEEDDDDVTSSNVLCEKYVWNQCSKRSHFHGMSHLPYQWQVKMHDGWIFFEASQNYLIEQSFCSLQKRIGGIKVSESLMALINFDSMKALIYIQSDGEDIPGESVEVQRLSTASYITGADGNMAELTQWCWYFNDGSKWAPYESGNLQYTLELKYLSGQLTYLFEKGQFQYEISFSEMRQTNMNSSKQRPIMRRPMFVSAEDVERHNKVFHPSLLQEQPRHSITIPEWWAPLDCHQTVELVKLRVGATAEDEQVQNQFFSSMDRSQFRIKSLFRIQNPTLWEKYCSMKKTMETALRREGIDRPVNEKQLFHGTTHDVNVIRGICHNNVDFRLSGKNATVYGEGAYFARDAKYSNSYATGVVQFMFVCKVLVGQYTKGDSSYRRPPARVGHTLYDSCVNDTDDPIVYVVFELAQSYPQYLIEYTRITSAGRAAYPFVAPALELSSQTRATALKSAITPMSYPATSTSSSQSTSSPHSGYPSPPYAATSYPYPHVAATEATSAVQHSPSSTGSENKTMKTDKSCVLQ